MSVALSKFLHSVCRRAAYRIRIRTNQLRRFPVTQPAEVMIGNCLPLSERQGGNQLPDIAVAYRCPSTPFSHSGSSSGGVGETMRARRGKLASDVYCFAVGHAHQPGLNTARHTCSTVSPWVATACSKGRFISYTI